MSVASETPLILQACGRFTGRGYLLDSSDSFVEQYCLLYILIPQHEERCSLIWLPRCIGLVGLRLYNHLQEQLRIQ